MMPTYWFKKYIFYCEIEHTKVNEINVRFNDFSPLDFLKVYLF